MIHSFIHLFQESVIIRNYVTNWVEDERANEDEDDDDDDSIQHHNDTTSLLILYNLCHK